jgi:hypothetical protein
MRFRFIAVGLVTLLLIGGAIHWTPLWMFVVVTPLWLDLCFTWEEERIRASILRDLHALREIGWDDNPHDPS